MHRDAFTAVVLTSAKLNPLPFMPCIHGLGSSGPWGEPKDHSSKNTG